MSEAKVTKSSEAKVTKSSSEAKVTKEDQSCRSKSTILSGSKPPNKVRETHSIPSNLKSEKGEPRKPRFTKENFMVSKDNSHPKSGKANSQFS